MKQELPSFHSKMIRSFGRIKSRKLSLQKKFLLENFLPKIKLDINSINQTGSRLKEQSNILEIGFGFGDFLFNLAQKNPQKNIYGFEPHINGIVNLLELVNKENLNNIKISNADIRLEIANFTDEFFDEIYILFPDPWPKFKHYKRRLITTNFLDNILASKLKKSSKIIIATDHDAYKTWILANILDCKKLHWNANSKKDWQNFPQNWHATKYQKKAIAEGRIPVIFELVKS
jgi:tRNA (guanine-N7-)-methyltransferase